MGRYDTSNGGAIYLVEDEHQAATLDVRDPATLAFVTQTTLSVDDTAKVIDALREKFPAIQGPRKDDICYATQNRQDAVKSLAEEVIWCWSLDRRIVPTPIGFASWQSDAAPTPT